LARLGIVDYWAGDPAAGRLLIEEGLALSREVDDKLGTAWWLEMLALTLVELGELGQAQSLAEEGVLRCRELGDRRDQATSLFALAAVALELGELETAHLRAREAPVLCRELGDKILIAATLEIFACLSAQQSQPSRALRTAGAGAALAVAYGFVLPRGWQDRIEREEKAAYRTLGTEAADTAWKQGHDLPLEQVIDEALAS